MLLWTVGNFLMRMSNDRHPVFYYVYLVSGFGKVEKVGSFFFFFLSLQLVINVMLNLWMNRSKNKPF